jgi:hypothetical protein
MGGFKFPWLRCAEELEGTMELKKIALVVRTPDEQDNYTDLQDWCARRKEKPIIDILPLSLPYRKNDQVNSVFYHPPQENYDIIIVHRQIELHEGNWSYAFLDRLNGMLAAEGKIIVPCGRSAPYRRDIPDERLDALFRQQGHVLSSEYQIYTQVSQGLNRPLGQDISILDVFYEELDRMLEMEFDRLEAGSGDPLIDAIQQLGYRYAGMRNKAPALDFVLKSFSKSAKELHVVDVGGGAGTLILEMALDKETPVRFGTVIDPDRVIVEQGKITTTLLMSRLPATAGPQPMVEYVCSGAIDCHWPHTDVVVMIGTLLLIPRELQQACLDKAWAALRSGGVLAIQENMKVADEKKGGHYNHLRFEPDELDALMSRYGPVRYFHGTHLMEIPSASMARQTVYRAVQK